MIEDIGAVARGDPNDSNDVETVAARVIGIHQFESE